MPSYGETDVIVNSTTVGIIRVLSMSAASALYPRLRMILGCTLNENPGREPKPAFPGLEMRDLRGEFRLTENGDVIGTIEWIGARYHYQANGYENQLEVMCDLDPLRIEAIERRRNGGEPQFFLQLWPMLAGQAGQYRTDCRPMQLHVPRDRWLETLSQLKGKRWALIEIETSIASTDLFYPAVGHIQEAWAKIDNGDFDAAVLCCRKAVDAIDRIAPKDDSDKEGERQDSNVRKLLEKGISQKRGEYYAAIFSKVKRVAAHAAHEFDPQPFSRQEARLIVAVTANLVSLVATAEGRVQQPE